MRMWLTVALSLLIGGAAGYALGAWAHRSPIPELVRMAGGERGAAVVVAGALGLREAAGWWRDAKAAATQRQLDQCLAETARRADALDRAITTREAALNALRDSAAADRTRTELLYANDPECARWAAEPVCAGLRVPAGAPIRLDPGRADGAAGPPYDVRADPPER